MPCTTQLRNAGRRSGQSLAQQRLVHPVTTQDWTCSGRTRLAGEESGHAQHATPAPPTQTGNTAPCPAGRRQLDSVMRSQWWIQERVIGLEQIENRTIAAKHVLEETNRFFVHIGAKLCELRIQRFVLVIVAIKIANVQPLAGEVYRQPPDPIVLKHAVRLRDECLGTLQLSCPGNTSKLLVGQRRPQEIAQPRGELEIRNLTRLAPFAWLLQFVEKGWRCQHA